MTGSELNGHCQKMQNPLRTMVCRLYLFCQILLFLLAINLFPIFKGMTRPSDRRMKKASILGIGCCAVIYSLSGFMGYCMYGRNVQSNFLLAFKRQDLNGVVYFFLNFGFLLSVFFSFSVVFFSARNNFIAVVKSIIKIVMKPNEEEAPLIHRDRALNFIRQRDKIIFRVSTLVLFGIAVLIAILVDSIQDVFNVVGAIATNLVLVLLPSLIYWQLIRKKQKEKKLTYYAAFGVFIFSIPFGIFSVVSNYLS